MSKIKIAFFDIDGTLIDMQTKKITDKMVETLRRLQESGIIICIATGRAPAELPKIEGVDFDAFLTYNGSYCYTNEGQTIFSNPIRSEDVRTILRNATGLGRPVMLATKDRLAANGREKDLVDYAAIAKIEVKVADDFDELLNETIYQLMVGGREDSHAALLKDVHNAKIAAWWDRAMDIIPADGGKGIGVEKMLEYYHLDKSEAIAFGDGNNDIEMLNAVGTGVAMLNGSEKLKAIATTVCGSCAEDGIYHYCVENKLI